MLANLAKSRLALSTIEEKVLLHVSGLGLVVFATSKATLGCATCAS